MCIARVIKGIKFPTPKTGVVIVSYPMEFRPGTSGVSDAQWIQQAHELGLLGD